MTKAQKKKKEARTKEVKFIKELFADFKDTLTEALGDTGVFIKKHKLLLVIAFLGFLWYRNRQFTIGGFVKELEKRIKGDRAY